MDHIVSNPPNGSAILAYGTAPRSHSLWKWIIAAGITLAAIICVSVGYLILFASVQLPERRLATVTLRPSDIEIQSALIRDLPAPWRAAIETKMHAPISIGSWIGDDGKLYSFALVPRWTTIAKTEHLQTQAHGFSMLITDHEPVLEGVPLRRLWKMRRELKIHNAAWEVDGSVLEGIALSEDVSGTEIITGTWDGRVGRINLSASSAGPAGEDLIAVSLQPDRDDVAPIIQALPTQGLDLSAIATPPTRILINPETQDIRVGWSERLSDKEQGLVLGAFGLGATTAYELPDASTISQLSPTSTSEDLNATNTYFTPRGIESLSDEKNPSDCPGIPRFVLQGSALSNLLKQYGAPESWIQALSFIRIHEDEEGAVICVPEINLH